MNDLIVHDDFYQYFDREKDLHRLFSVKSIYDLTILHDRSVYLLYDTYTEKAGLVLTPYYDCVIGDGTLPFYTSACITKDTPYFRIQESAPRLVIWTKTDPLPISATCVIRIDIDEIYTTIQAIKSWPSTISQEKSIIVFDLDETLIDSENKMYPNAIDVLKIARNYFDLLVLWSHGSSLHVDEHITKYFSNIKFDLVLSNSNDQPKSPKNLLYLYNYFPNTLFTTSWLIDDSPYNITAEYTHVAIPLKYSDSINSLPLVLK